MTRKPGSTVHAAVRLLAGACALGLTTACAVLNQQSDPVQTAVPAKVAPDPSRKADLPSVAELQKLVNEAHEKFKGVKDGKNADYIPALAKVPSGLFGVVIVTVNGDVVSAGDADYTFAIESVSKPFTIAHVMNEQGYEAVQEKIGVEPTGLPFNSKLAVELILKARSVNPLVNAGAIGVGEHDPGQDRGRALADRAAESQGLCRRGARGDAGHLRVRVHHRLEQPRHREQPVQLRAALCRSRGNACAYTRKQCSVGLNAKQLAVMGGTLANGGVNPVTGKRVIEEEIVDEILAVMLTAGFYDESGQWSAESGLPSKTGVGGGIVSVVPGKMAIVGLLAAAQRGGQQRAGTAGHQVHREGAEREHLPAPLRAAADLFAWSDAFEGGPRGTRSWRHDGGRHGFDPGPAGLERFEWRRRGLLFPVRGGWSKHHRNMRGSVNEAGTSARSDNRHSV